MVVFVLAAIAAYLLLTQTVGAPIIWATARRRKVWDAFVHIVRWLPTGLALGTLGLALYTLESGPLEQKFLNEVRSLALAPETIHAVLGALAGTIIATIPHWAGGNTTELQKWRLILVAGALSSVVLAALLAPYASRLLERTSGVETPYLKVQFEATAEKQLNPKIKRDLVSFDKFEDLPRSLRFIQYDCGQRALEAGGIERFKNENKYRPEYENFQNAIAFRRQWTHYFNYVLDAQRKGYSDEILKGRVRSLAEKFLRLISDPDHFGDNYTAVLGERRRQIDSLTGTKSTRAEDKLPPEEEQRQNRKEDPDPNWCDPPADKECNISEEEVRRLVENTRYVHGFAASLLVFTGDTEDNIWIWRLAKGILEKDINVNGSLAASLYFGGRDFNDVLALRDIAAETVKSYEAAVKSFDANNAVDREIKEKLGKRYRRIDFLARVELAYLSAQKGLSSQEEAWPFEEVRWKQIQADTENALNELNGDPPPVFACTDVGTDIYIKDVYAYTRLAFEAYKLKSSGIAPDQGTVSDARKMLEDARATVLNALRALDTPRPYREPAPTCIVKTEAKAWLKRISSHLKLAEAMQPRGQ